MCINDALRFNFVILIFIAHIDYGNIFNILVPIPSVSIANVIFPAVLQAS